MRNLGWGRAAAENRAADRCEICGVYPGVLHHHHRRPRGMGGGSNSVTESASNYLMLCPKDHLVLVEMNREKALDMGWLVPQGVDPSTVMVRLFDGAFYLTDDGARVPIIGTGPLVERGHSSPED